MGFLFLKPSKISEKNIIRNIIEKKEIGKQEQLSDIFKKDKVWGTLVYQSGHLKGQRAYLQVMQIIQREKRIRLQQIIC